jgi:triacylglycerol esterase/lipase EstA (alpha/beta hydrolase family)
MRERVCFSLWRASSSATDQVRLAKRGRSCSSTDARERRRARLISGVWLPPAGQAFACWTSFRRGHIAALSDQVIARVEEILVATCADRVDALGHSLGGVVIFHTLLRGGGERSLGTCLALGAPFHGTRMANFSSSPLLRQFAPGSPMLGDLCAKLEAPGAVSSLTRLVSIWSNYDNVVLPNTSAVLPSPPAENIRVDFVGHVSMLFSATVARQVERVLAGSI